ncbi:potassium-transporting ATPase subunit KdpC [Nocardioides mangrovi]|uniref:Potassium-transporting ATPase KdpC subunit n=1 Tax=Nocardioides mangrovi TaxID=2874580 RepID=A0ABS7UH74_9ACTN|nr:potassium-transporting ATPase subunit KdpC [Nocardioides mangrovi]MBZ5740150.1 potassium-transporting ATPase subunit KdpC [Nocardioides mangrovi]
MKDIYTLFRHSLAGLRMLVAMTVLLGVAYPLAVTGIAQVAFPWQANGSLVTATGEHTEDADEAVGSARLGQVVDDDALFQNRPSAAGDGYDPLNSYGTNLGPNDPDLVASIIELEAQVAEREGVDPADVPPDAVTSSASGLDPDISVAYADLQAPRVAEANGLTEDQVRDLVDEHTTGRTWGVLGEPHVNVLELNIAVRQLAGS